VITCCKGPQDEVVERLELATAMKRSVMAYRLRDIALNIHKKHELYTEVHMQSRFTGLEN
jgi:hypothetical protein